MHSAPEPHMSLMRQQILRPSYSADVLSQIERIRSATSEPEVLEAMVRATIALGASASLYMASIPEDASQESTITLLACDPVVAHQLCVSTMTTHPWYRYARGHLTSATDNQFVHTNDAEDSEAARASVRGFASYLIVPTPARPGLDRFGMFCLGSAVPHDFDDDGVHVVKMLANALASELHTWFAVHLQQSLQAQARLQAADLKLLKFERQGLSSKQIAAQTGLSVASVDSRFQRLNAKLQCANRRDSARRAAENGLV